MSSLLSTLFVFLLMFPFLIVVADHGSSIGGTLACLAQGCGFDPLAEDGSNGGEVNVAYTCCLP